MPRARRRSKTISRRPSAILSARYVIVGDRQYSGPLYDALPAGGVIARFGVGHDGIDKSRATAARSVVHQHAGRSRSVGGRTRDAARGRRRTETDRRRWRAWRAARGSRPRASDLSRQDDWRLIGCGGIGRARRAHRRAWLRHAGGRLHQARRTSAGGHRSFRARDERFRGGGPRRRFRQPAHAGKAGERRVHQSRASRADGPASLAHQHRPRRGRGRRRRSSKRWRRAASPERRSTCSRASRTCRRQARGDLRSLPNVILTPHVGSNTVESNGRMAERALQNVQFAVEGARRADGFAQSRGVADDVVIPLSAALSLTQIPTRSCWSS